MANKRPLLSICIPTYNRAVLLKSSLLSVGPQLVGMEDRVELVVSDNCSPDDTQKVVQEAQKSFPIKYNRNAENFGAIKNVLILADELASGEYCWILGDDDLIRPGGVARVLEVLSTHPDVDYLYVNFYHLEMERFKAYPQPATSFDIKETLRPGNQFVDDHLLDSWEEVIDPRISTVFLGAIQSSVVRRSVWKEGIPSLQVGTTYSNLDSTYPHIVVYARGLVGRKAYYLGNPQVMVIDGVRDWIGFVPIIVLVRLNEALDLYRINGVGRERINRCRRALLLLCGGSFYDLFFESTSCGRQYISVKSFISSYGLRPEFVVSFSARLVRSVLSLKGLSGAPSRFKLAANRLFFKDGAY